MTSVSPRKAVEKDPAAIQRETAAYVEHINNMLSGDVKLDGLIPISEPNEFFTKARNGVLLCKIVNAIKPGTIDESKINYSAAVGNIKTPGTKDAWEIAENNNMAIEGAKKIGVKVVNIGNEDILGGNVDLLLGLAWQMIRAHLLAEVNVASHPELVRLLRKGEGIRDLLDVSAEQVLLRWFNYHLARAGHPRTVANFSSDISDSECYAALMCQIAPDFADSALVRNLTGQTDLEARADAVLQHAAKLGCRRFVTAKDIAEGHSRLNLAFTATLFNAHIGIRMPTEEEIAEIYQRMEMLEATIADLRSALRGKEHEAQTAAHNHSATATALKHAVEALTANCTNAQAELEELRSRIADCEGASKEFAETVKSQMEQARRHDMELRSTILYGATRSNADISRKIEERLNDLTAAHGAPASAFDSMRECEEVLKDLLSLIQEENADLRARQDVNVLRQAESRDRMRTDILSAIGGDASKVLAECKGDNEDDSIERLVARLCELAVAQQKEIADQRDKMKRMDAINQIMGEKIREIAEMNSKKEDEPCPKCGKSPKSERREKTVKGATPRAE
eukprot:Opistho-2@70696